jgi:hypothetical protein
VANSGATYSSDYSGEGGIQELVSNAGFFAPAQWWIQFGYNGDTSGYGGTSGGSDMEPKDLSAFAGGYLKFDAKSSAYTTGGVAMIFNVYIETGNNSSSRTSYEYNPGYAPADTNWHTVVIPLSSFGGIDLTHILIPAEFYFADDDGCTVSIDNIRWDKNP